MILVTGGTGYLGQPLVTRLLEQGHSVRVISRSGTAVSGEAIKADVTEPGSLDRALTGIHTVYHLAALVDHYASAETLYRVNVQGSLNLIKAAIRNGARRFVHCSSVSAEPGGGSTGYGRSKIEAERQLRAYGSDIHLVMIRPGPVYDEGRRNLCRLVHFSKRTGIAPGILPDVQVHLASRRNVTEAFILACEHGGTGEAYAICDPEPVRRSTLSRIIAEETGARHLALPLPVFYPVLYLFAVVFEGLHTGFGCRPPLSRHYLKVLTRERRYNIQKARNELRYSPASTEKHFRESVRNCLSAN